MIPIDFEMVVFKEEETFVAYSPELDVSSCGASVAEAGANLKTAVRLFIEEAERMGTLTDILNNLRSAGIAREEYFRLLQET